MLERGYGRIVMVSSVTGPLTTNPESAGYASAKAAMDGLMRTIAIENAAARRHVQLGPAGLDRDRARSSREEVVAGEHTPGRVAAERRRRSPRRSRSSRPRARATSPGRRSSSTAATTSRSTRARGTPGTDPRRPSGHDARRRSVSGRCAGGGRAASSNLARRIVPAASASRTSPVTVSDAGTPTASPK